jgi:trk system potassium uptake protein TrkA
MGRRADKVHIVVMGCGRVGSALAHKLEQLDHSVSVIDQDPEAFRRLGEEFRGDRITGVGFDQETLVSAGIERASAFAAVSSGDNSNIIAARVARESFGVQKVVARIYDSRRAEVYERLGIPTVASVPWTTSKLLKTVLGEATSEVWRDPSGAVALVTVTPNEGWVGHRLTDFEAATAGRVALVTRFGTGQLPLSSMLIQSGDTLHILTTDSDLATLRHTSEQPPSGYVG